MRNELLMGASVLALIELNSGYVEAQTPVVVTAGTGCPGGCTYPDPNSAFAALDGDYSKIYDVQIQPGVYERGGFHKLSFNGTVEGMGTIASNITLGNGTVVSSTAPGVIFECLACGSGQPQAEVIVGTETSPYPGDNMVLKNFEINGTITSNSTGGTVSIKMPRCVQTQGIGNFLVQNMAFLNCQDGIVGDPWTPTDGSGVILISGSVFNNNCSPAGPSHGFYLAYGTLAVGAVSVVMSGTTITGTANTFGECSNGYNNKSRSTVTEIEGNFYYQNFVCASSGAIDIPNGGSILIQNNVMVMGPQTGQDCHGSSDASQAILVGGLLGQFVPANWLINNNTITLSGVTKPFHSVSNLQVDPGTILLTNNTLPANIPQNIILGGLGTIGTGNVYADSTPVTPVVQNSMIQGNTVLQDYRGTSGPQTLNVTTSSRSVWGGNGLLTMTMATNVAGLFIASGPGGLNLSVPRGPNVIAVWGAANSTNIINTVFGNTQFYTQGTNDQINIGALPSNPGPLCETLNPVVVESGKTTVTFNAHNGATGNPTCKVYVQNGGTVSVVDDVFNAANNDVSIDGWSGATAMISGRSVRATFATTDSVVVENNLSLTAATGPTIIISGTITGGGVNCGPIATAAGGTVTAISGWSCTSFESSAGAPVDVRTDPVSINYVDQFVGGGTLYAGLDKVTVSGSARSLGPPPRPVALHVQNAAAGSTLGSGSGAFSVYLDGPGVAAVGRNATQQQSDYVEIDANGSGSINIQQTWRTGFDTCGLGTGVTVVSSTQSGGNDILKFSTGGTIQFTASTNVTCGTVTVGPSPLAFTQSTPLIAPIQPGGIVGVISGGNPPYSVADTTHFAVAGNNLDAAAILNAATYDTTISDGATSPAFTSIGTCDNGTVWQVPSPPAGTVDLNGFGVAYCSIKVSNATVVQLARGAALDVTGSGDRIFAQYANGPGGGHARYAINGSSDFLDAGVYATGFNEGAGGAGNVDVIGSGNTLEFANTFASYHGAGGNNWLIPGNGGTWIWRTDTGGDQGVTFPDTVNIYPVLVAPTGSGFACSPSATAACFAANIGELTNPGTIGGHRLQQSGTVLAGNGPLLYFHDCAPGVNTTKAQMFSGSGAGTFAAPTLPTWPAAESSPFHMTAAIAPGTGTLASYGIMTVSTIAAGSNVVAPGMVVTGGSIAANTVVVGYDGGTGGTGKYLVNNSQSLVSTALTLTNGPATGLLTPSHPQMQWYGGTAINIEIPDPGGIWIPQLPIVQDAYDLANGNPTVTVAATVVSGKWSNGSTLQTISATQAPPGVNEPIVSLHYLPPAQANCVGPLCTGSPAANTDTMSFTFTNSHGTSVSMSKQVITWYGGVCP